MKRDFTAPIRKSIGIGLVGFVLLMQQAVAQSSKAAVPDFTGVYESVANGVNLPGGLKNEGSPEEISLQPAAAAKAQSTKLGPDPANTCQVIGPFRMMARDKNMIDIVPSPGTNRMFIFFKMFSWVIFARFFSTSGPD